MGNDEHGPAYPEPPEHTSGCKTRYRHCRACTCERPYRCPICKGDENRYLVCDYPGCTDGRDRGHPRGAVSRETYEPHPPAPWPVAFVGWAVMVAVLVYMAWPLH